MGKGSSKKVTGQVQVAGHSSLHSPDACSTFKLLLILILLCYLPKHAQICQAGEGIKITCSRVTACQDSKQCLEAG